MRRVSQGLALAAGLLLLAVSTQAYPESAAPSLNPLVKAAWHEPEVVKAGTQWRGFLQLQENHSVERAHYQVCNVGDGFCFAPLTPAHHIGNDTFSFDTNDYLANGVPVHWKAGWRVGVHWYLEHRDGNTTWIPRAPPAVDEQVPLEDLYLTFDIPADKKGAPGLAAASLIVAVAGAARLRRR
jgi:hypothetical protein